MAFYDLNKQERLKVVEDINRLICEELKKGKKTHTHKLFDNEDTYVRKTAYLTIGRMYLKHEEHRSRAVEVLWKLFTSKSYRVRQTVINAAGEIGKTDFETVRLFFDRGLFDKHPAPRNAVIGSIKKMGEKNPKPVLKWAENYLHHPDKEIRREICHGIELRGRKHPSDILPLLKELQFDTTARVRKTLIHVLGQIAYKQNCLPIVLKHLKSWKNKELVTAALEEIIDVHYRYRNFSSLTQEEAIRSISRNFSIGKKQRD